MISNQIWKVGDAPLIAWYGDDFTGTLAALEVLAFAGLPSVVFLRPTTQEQRARFTDVAAVGLAGTARAETPEWMDSRLPQIYRWLDETGARLVAYKVCSTLDSAPETGSIGRAAEIAARHFRQQTIPCLVAAPSMGRFQAFGSLFATATDGKIHRLDRHPVMTVHPVTPMDEADIRFHLARQMSMDISLQDISTLAQTELDWPAGIVALDACTDEHMENIGRHLWKGRHTRRFVIGSQGIQMALLAHWKSLKSLPCTERRTTASRRPTAVISGSVSLTTKGQIDHALANGFAGIRLDPCALTASVATREKTIAEAVERAAECLAVGQNPLLFTAMGPNDPAVAAFTGCLIERNTPKATGYRTLGDALGMCLKAIVQQTSVSRCIVAGGDTSGRIMDMLDGYAATAITSFEHGCSLFKLHADSEQDALEIMLKGGQMGRQSILVDVANGNRS